MSASSSARRSIFELHFADAVEHAEDAQILPYREAMRHIDVGTLKIHAPKHQVTLARHVATKHVDASGRRLDQPHDHADGRGFARAIASKQSRHGAGREREIQRSHRKGLAIGLGKIFDCERDIGARV